MTINKLRRSCGNPWMLRPILAKNKPKIQIRLSKLVRKKLTWLSSHQPNNNKKILQPIRSVNKMTSSLMPISRKSTILPRSGIRNLTRKNCRNLIQSWLEHLLLSKKCKNRNKTKRRKIRTAIVIWRPRRPNCSPLSSVASERSGIPSTVISQNRWLTRRNKRSKWIWSHLASLWVPTYFSHKSVERSLSKISQNLMQNK